MDLTENSPLLFAVSESCDMSIPKVKGLSVLYAAICVVDVFGIFPIVVLPRAIIECGWLGIPLAIFIFSIQIYTASLLGNCWVIAEYLDKTIASKNRYPYAAIAEMAFGTYVANIVTILLDIAVFGGGIPNLIVAAQNLEILGHQLSNTHFDLSFCYWMLILGFTLCPFLWLGSPKDMKILCSTSAIIVFSVSTMIWICILKDVSPHTATSSIQSKDATWQNIISAYGILAFQFDIHPMLLTIQVDMKQKSKISYAVFIGFLATGSLFTITTVLASLKYGTNVYPNILQGLPPSLPLYITVLLVTVQLCLTSAMSNSALYQHIEDYFNISRDFNYKRCLIRSGLTALAVIGAEIVPKFDLVMSLIGGTLTGPLVFILPPLLYLKMLSLKRQYISNLSLQTANHYMYHGDFNSSISTSSCCDQCVTAVQKQNGIVNLDNIRHNQHHVKYIELMHGNSYCVLQFLLASFIIIFGIFATCSTTYINIFDAFKYTTFTPPCLYNLTAK